MSFESSLYGNRSRSRTQSFHDSSQSTSNAQFALAGVLESDENPRLLIKQFPHRGLGSEDQEKKLRSGSESGQQKSRLRDDDRKGHLDILLRATEQFLAQGDVAKAAKAFGIILQLRPRTQSIDIRLHNLWSIGAEILMRQREKLQTVEQQFAELSNHRNRTASASSNGIQMVASWWGSSSNMSEIKSYFEILIRQYAYDHKLPHKISAVDFWLALLSCELNHIYTEHLGGILRLEDEYRLQRTESAYQESPNPSDSISRHSGLDGADSKLQYEPSEHWIKKQMEENCQRTLTDLWDINQRMEKLMDQLPYSKNAQFLQLKEMMSLLSIELSSATADISAS